MRSVCSGRWQRDSRGWARRHQRRRARSTSRKRFEKNVRRLLNQSRSSCRAFQRCQRRVELNLVPHKTSPQHTTARTHTPASSLQHQQSIAIKGIQEIDQAQAPAGAQSMPECGSQGAGEGAAGMRGDAARRNTITGSLRARTSRAAVHMARRLAWVPAWTAENVKRQPEWYATSINTIRYNRPCTNVRTRA